MSRTFCRWCGRQLDSRMVEGRVREVCGVCGRIHYINPLPVASILLPNEHKEVLLVKRGREPHKGMWCLPIGFAEVGETISEAARRELREEAGVEAEIIGLLDVSSHHEPIYGDLLIVTFEGRWTGGAPRPGDDADQALWFSIQELPRLAFDAQARAMQRYLTIHAPEWTIRDSMESLVRGVSAPEEGETSLLSDDLLRFLATTPEPVVRAWLAVVRLHPTTERYRASDPDRLAENAIALLGHFSTWLPGRDAGVELRGHCEALAELRRSQGIPLSQLLSSLSLLKRQVWKHQLSAHPGRYPLDTYILMELDMRLSYFFDLVTYHVSRAYEPSSEA